MPIVLCAHAWEISGGRSDDEGQEDNADAYGSHGRVNRGGDDALVKVVPPDFGSRPCHGRRNGKRGYQRHCARVLGWESVSCHLRTTTFTNSQMKHQYEFPMRIENPSGFPESGWHACSITYHCQVQASSQDNVSRQC